MLFSVPCFDTCSIHFLMNQLKWSVWCSSFFPFLHYVAQFFFRDCWLVQHIYSFDLCCLKHRQRTYVAARLPAGRQVCQFRHPGYAPIVYRTAIPFLPYTVFSCPFCTMYVCSRNASSSLSPGICTLFSRKPTCSIHKFFDTLT